MNLWQIFGLIAFLVGDVFTRCSGADCEKYSCVSDFYVHRPLETFQRPALTFNSLCACEQDWNTMFCNQTLTALHENIGPLPTVCICRKFTDNGSRCKQFMTRCYTRKNNENANTTCVCHHNPTDYPYDICKNLYPRDSTFANRQAILDKNRERSQGTVEYVELLGKKVSTSVVSYIIIGLLMSVSVLTLVMLVLGGKRLREKRTERQRQIRLARETLILQRADDDRYLPSA
ncbi:hypothetical protein CAEBREN_19259 [Caenorhabditis brenneri]|uniref:EGF-like domain-containing protein n=1 Tax=Caenorhabditis brenneri TaxID=135651 RepID=G0MBN1_CAEBE|nr:hypothetical protein CAEBREN_19259 [Caenorhabditis brenneri]